MICPLYKAALISNMGKHYDPVLFIDNVRVDENLIIGCDRDNCECWNLSTGTCGLNNFSISHNCSL